MQWLVENPRNERVAAAAVAALGPKATIHRGPVSTALDAQVRFVFATDLAAYVAGLPADGRALQTTILVNAERFEVLDLLEAHDLGGAIECEEHDSWTNEHARMFVRRDVLDLERGKVIGGAGRESEHFVLWTRECKLDELVRDYASALPTKFDELVITVAQAREHHLPAVGMRMRTGQVGMSPRVFPYPGWYLQFESPPGGLQIFDVRVCNEAAAEAVVRESFLADRDETLRYTGIEQVSFAGVTRAAALCETGGDNSFMRMGWCLVPIEHAAGRLVVRMANRLPVGEAPSWAHIIAFRGHQFLAGSFTLMEA